MSQVTPPRRETQRIASWVVLLTFGLIGMTAVGVRFARLGWGLGEGMPFSDEAVVWPDTLLAFVDHGVSAHSIVDTDLVYPPLFGYLAGGLVAGARACALVPDPRADSFAGVFFLTRGLCATFGVIAVALSACLGWRFYGPGVGLLAGAIMAVAPLNAMQVHYVSTDPLMVVMVLVTLLASCHLRARPSPLLAVAAGAGVALTFSTKYTGLAIGIAPAWAVLEIAAERRSLRPLVVLGGALLLGFAMGLLVGCPPCILRFREMRTWLSVYAGLMSAGGLAYRNNFLSPTLGWYGRPYLYQLVASLPYGLGWPVYLAAICGVVRAILRRSPTDRLLLVALTTMFLLIARSDVTFPRYLLPLYPILAIFAADALSGVPSAGFVRAPVIAFVLLYSLALTVSQVARFSVSQQMAVAEWLQQRSLARAEAGAKVGIAAPSAALADYYGLETPLRARGIDFAVITQKNWTTADIDFLVVPEWTSISARRDDPNGVLSTHLRRLEGGDTSWVEARRWHSRYLDDRFYRWLDPAFAGDLWQGEIGFVVYERAPGDARRP